MKKRAASGQAFNRNRREKQKQAESRNNCHAESQEFMNNTKKSAKNPGQKILRWVLNAVILPLLMEAAYLIVWNIREKKKKRRQQ